MKKTVAVGFSGGVDSAVSALLLKQQGFAVTGVFLYCFDQAGIPCTADEDRKMAIKVADSLAIPLKIIDLRGQYRRSVVDYFFSEYKAGRTPNPDVMCNKEIKFGLFYKQMIEKEGFDYIATGHYARILRNEECTMNNVQVDKMKYFLAKGIDESKDQSYFLYLLKSQQLEHILFSIGDCNKDQIRKIAKANKLPNWDRPDSQGICFIGEINIKKFLSTKFKVRKGMVLDRNGNIIGEHDGAWFYTIGQRHGFKITEDRRLKVEDRNKKPLYILSKNSERNELIVAEKDECFSTELNVENFHWINQTNGLSNLIHLSNIGNLKVRIRHLGELYPCKIKPITKNQSLTTKIELQLLKPAFAVAPGQSAVVYLEDLVLGGGVIC